MSSSERLRLVVSATCVTGFACIACIACSAPSASSAGNATTSHARSVALAFSADAPLGGEAYVCFEFDAHALDGRFIQSIRWSPPSGAIELHHATLYAVPDAATATDSCERMGLHATGMHVWARGGDDLVLPSGVAVTLPGGTAKLVVQAHVLRPRIGDSSAAMVRIGTVDDPPENIAAWLAASAPVPAMRPHHLETASASCVASSPMHLQSIWPHMHRLGREIHAALVRADGTRTPLIDVAPWSFDRQHTYPMSVEIAAGDAVETKCVWQNDSSDYVLPGPASSDEMCVQGLIVWPATAAAWTPGSCP